MSMKFVVSNDVLSVMTQQSDTANQDLGGLIKKLAEAGEPIRNSFQGRGRAMFDQFHAGATEFGAALNMKLAGIAEGVGGMNSSYFQFDDEAADLAQRNMGAAPFASSPFAPR